MLHMATPLLAIPAWIRDGIKTSPGLISYGDWLSDGAFDAAAWLGRLLAKIIDVFGFGEIMGIVFAVTKPNTRFLTETEIAQARIVLGDAVPYWQVRVDSKSIISRIVSFLIGVNYTAVTTWHTINFSHRITTHPGDSFMRWLIHELTHVAQYEANGTQCIFGAIRATAYDYTYLPIADKDLADLDVEQQSNIVADAYMVAHRDGQTDDQKRMVRQAKQGLFNHDIKC